jgi:hypothetical protein
VNTGKALHQASAIDNRRIFFKLSEVIVKSIELVGKKPIIIEMEI